MSRHSRALVVSDEEHQLPLASAGGRQVAPHTTSGPGRLLHQAYTSIGQSIEKRANRLAHKVGLDPIAVTEIIEKAFEVTTEERQAKLDDLHDRLGTADDHSMRELQKC